MRSSRKYSHEELMNAAVATAKTINFPGIHLAESSEIPATPEPQLTWLQRRAIDLKVMTMAQPPPTPYWNASMVSAWVAVIGVTILLLSSIGGLYIYTRDTSRSDGITEGRRLEREAQLQKEIDALTIELQVQRDSCELNDKPKEKKK